MEKKWGYRYVSQPPVASERLTLTASGQVGYMLKTPSGMAPRSMPRRAV